MDVSPIPGCYVCLENFSQGSWESKGPNTDMHDEVQWGGGGVEGAERVGEQSWCQSFEGTGQGLVSWGCGMMPF